MKDATIIALSLALVFVLIATAALAWGPGRGYGWGPGSGYGYTAIANVTAEQSAKIQAVQKAYLDKIAPLQQELLKKRTELRSLRLSQNPDSSAITAKETEILSIQTKLQEKAANLRLEISKVLPPEQSAQAAAYSSGFGPRMGKMGHMARW